MINGLMFKFVGAGDAKALDHLPVACKDSIAILFMFDLTSRCTLKRFVIDYQSKYAVNNFIIFQC